MATVCKWVTVRWPVWLGVAIALAVLSPASKAAIGTELADTLEQLAREGAFSGAVVILGSDGVRFAQGFGFADPFTGRRFTPDTPVDSASLAKPVTAAAVLMLAGDGRIDLDAPVVRYLADTLTRRRPSATCSPTRPDFRLRNRSSPSAARPTRCCWPRSGRAVCRRSSRRERRSSTATSAIRRSRCSSSVSAAKAYLPFVRERLAVPAGVTIRPARLAEWSGRAIGHRHGADGKIERADSYENELFYGTANLSISAHQLARWGAEWWKPTLKPLIVMATTPASIAGNTSGLSWGNWYCAPERWPMPLRRASRGLPSPTVLGRRPNESRWRWSPTTRWRRRSSSGSRGRSSRSPSAATRLRNGSCRCCSRTTRCGQPRTGFRPVKR